MARKKKAPGPFEDEEDERSYAVALRLEVLAKRLEAVNQELIERIKTYEPDLAETDEGGEAT